MFWRYRIVTKESSLGKLHHYPEYRTWYLCWSPFYASSKVPLCFTEYELAYKHIDSDVRERRGSEKVLHTTYYDGLGRTERAG